VCKAPAARIIDMAKILCEEAGKPFEYEIIGLLPGEKLNEIMLSEEELIRAEDTGGYYKVHPWWSKSNFGALNSEYSSVDALVSEQAIRELIARADREFTQLEMSGGEYANF
jgi:UDP-glucose 4-epimerase